MVGAETWIDDCCRNKPPRFDGKVGRDAGGGVVVNGSRNRVEEDKKARQDVQYKHPNHTPNNNITTLYVRSSTRKYTIWGCAALPAEASDVAASSSIAELSKNMTISLSLFLVFFNFYFFTKLILVTVIAVSNLRVGKETTQFPGTTQSSTLVANLETA